MQRVAEELQSLSFAQAQAGSIAIGNSTENSDSSDANGVDKSNESVIEKLMTDLQEEKEDWFSELVVARRVKSS